MKNESSIQNFNAAAQAVLNKQQQLMKTASVQGANLQRELVDRRPHGQKNGVQETINIESNFCYLGAVGTQMNLHCQP